MNSGERVYALDIGTRTVVGVILQKDGDSFRIEDAEMFEHQTRAMVDGQIHDVEAVARAIAAVTAALEERTGQKLTEAAVAAAGRALRTALGRYEVKRELLTEITVEESLAMELAAVQEAQKQVGESQLGPALFCVGYSVIHYYLEEEPIASLVGQTGSLIAVEVVATFLPRVVVDSLFASLRRCNLAVSSLTLEPIAALSVAIPDNMRLLNLALVDVGAGTSDIALVRRGTTYGYAMVPLGGDEITESIVETYLVDFDTAETIKRSLASEDMLTFNDILGNQLTVPAAEIIECTRPAVVQQATSIAREIMNLNGKTPDAVLFVGGGSLTPLLLDEVAREMGMPRQRVGIRDRRTLASVKGDNPALEGPQAVTPLGIGYNALTSAGLPFIKVRVNGRELPLWSISGVSVAGALLGAGINLQNIYGHPGMGITVEVDGRVRSIKGSLGKPPRIELNGQPSSLDSPVSDGDEIVFEPGESGEDARARVRDLIDLDGYLVWVNDDQVKVTPRVEVNGTPAGADDWVPDRARVTTSPVVTVEEVLLALGVPAADLQQRVYSYTLNNQSMICRWSPVRVRLNGSLADPTQIVKAGDRLEYLDQGGHPTLGDVLPPGVQEIKIVLNGEETLVRARESIFMNEEPLPASTPLTNGMVLTVKPPVCMVSDLLPLVEIKPSTSGRLILKVNGEKAGFTTEVSQGDQVEIAWDREQ